MVAHRYLIPALVAVVVLASWAWAAGGIPSVDAAQTAAAANPLELTRQVEAMRRMHVRVTSARTTGERQALLDDSRQIMSAGVILMRRMRRELPTAATGELVSNVITEGQARQVRDFLTLMELLVQMRADQESVPQAEPTPALDSRLPGPRMAGASPLARNG